jgi:hypothetical protein
MLCFLKTKHVAGMSQMRHAHTISVAKPEIKFQSEDEGADGRIILKRPSGFTKTITFTEQLSE